MPKLLKNKPPEHLRPYIFHGVDLSWDSGDKEAVGDCPFCSREGKFSVDIKTGKAKCWVCAEGTDKGGMNPKLFIELLWKYSDQTTNDYADLAKNRGLLYPDTLMLWGAARSSITGDWLIPGYSVSGNLATLYKLGRVQGKQRLFPTPSLGHHIHGMNLFDDVREVVFICEGPWDGMMLWELLRSTKSTEDGYSPTSNHDASILSNSNVIAVPGCSTFFESWAILFGDKIVNIMFDNDHPRTHPKNGKRVEPGALTGAKRISRMLAASENPPKEINILDWHKYVN